MVVNQAGQTSNSIYSWKAASKALGRKAAGLIARGETKIPLKTLKDVHAYYAKKFGGTMPGKLAEELTWATNRWPELFSTLLASDILPLDITKTGKTMTIVEFFRDLLQIDAWDKAKLDFELPREIEYLTINLLARY